GPPSPNSVLVAGGSSPSLASTVNFAGGSASVPEPSGWLLAALGLVGLAVAGLRRSTRAASVAAGCK
ncbi:MAG TPA: PEP-CTERM sorting domain-containing protein, partial [Pirellulales bacterium]